MVSHLFYYQLALFALVWLFVMLHVTGSKPGLPTPPAPAKPKRMRSTEPKAFAGLTHKPPCALCEQETAATAPPPPRRPAPMPPTNRRPRTVDTSRHFCPHTACAYRGWLGLNNLRANGHPSGGPWRQLHCLTAECRPRQTCTIPPVEVGCARIGPAAASRRACCDTRPRHAYGR